MSEIEAEIINRIKTNSKRISQLESSSPFTLLKKSTTGNPATGRSGDILINTFDLKAFIWAEGAWRELTTWV